MDGASDFRRPLKDVSQGDSSSFLVAFSDSQQDPEQLISSIQLHLKERLSTFASINSHAEYVLVIQSFPDEVMGLLKQLSSCDIEKYGCFWLLTVGEAVRAAFVVASYAEDVPESTQGSYATASMLPILNELCLYLEYLVKRWDYASIQRSMSSAADKLKIYFYKTLSVTCDWLTKGPRLVHVEKCLALVVYRITQLCEAGETEAAIFPVLASISRAAFLSGCSEIILQIPELIMSINYAVTLLLRFKINFNVLMDFCRYLGYCLVTSAIAGNSIDETLCNRADVILTALLGLPNLRLVNYVVRQATNTPVGTPTQTTERYISTKEREELSFFYIINSIMRMKLLSQLVSTSERFQSECDFLLSSIQSRESEALDILASASHSHAASFVSLSNFASPTQNTLPSRKSRVMTSILEDGTYKEKLILVLSFFQHLVCESRKEKKVPSTGRVIKLVQTFGTGGLLQDVDVRTKLANDDIIMLINKINKYKYPGKMVFVEALRKIICLCELLFLKHASTTMNIKSDPNSLLKHVFQTLIPLADVMGVKPLMGFTGTGGLQCLTEPMLLEDKQLEEYSRCLQRVTMLEQQF